MDFLNNFLDETNDLRNKIDNGINDLRNKLNNAIKDLENKQPYIKYENVKLFFKAFSPSVDVLQNHENCFNFRYHSHNVKQLDFEYSEYIALLNKNMEVYLYILEQAFAPDVDVAFNGSILLAKQLGVPSEEILEDLESINAYFG